MPFRYVPLLRSKAGEANALKHLAEAAKERLFPIIHLVSNPPAGVNPKLVQAWSDRSLAVDGLYNFGLTGTASAFNSTCDFLRQNGVAAVPCIECDSDVRYIGAAKKYITSRHPAFVVKAGFNQLKNLRSWMTSHGLDAKNADLVVTAGHVASFPEDFADFVVYQLSQYFSSPGPWRSVSLASSAAPKDYSKLQVGRNDVPRLDWSLWNHVRSKLPVHFDYGDYGIAHPDLNEPPGVAMVRASVSVRYTIEDKWIILKGNPTTGPKGQPMSTQYHKHAKELRADPNFGKLIDCHGDNRIIQIVSRSTSGGSGSRATWVEIGVNRHLSFVSGRLP